ncbi:MAG: cytochrome c [Chloroflexi bacterium AL-W]|nr:cytochrome c [Chloroflexi bacterium AL-N1]NOK70891.1 cytochrome c [Chloroflexi bacterium AL-N10]NOK78560.1 cytochrome c [Chloroflexi bacterium AL-N5]NOK85792.1 cytochrome c [Chloroflexi bacterium AL-W]NOK92708.1 cytochrome c [Chloroflexi bacterium AL-N15]
MSGRNVKRKRTSSNLSIGIGTFMVVIIGGLFLVFLVARLPTTARETTVVSATIANPNDARLVALGEDVYQAQCASCHGANLEGQANWQEQLTSGGRPALPRDETGHTWHHPDEYLFSVTKYGGQARSPADYQNNMPAFRDILSDQELWAVIAYIKSTWPVDVQRMQAQTNTP